MRYALIVSGVCLVLAACSSSSRQPDSPDPTPADARTSVSVLARELHLTPGYNATRNRVVLAGDPGRVILYPGTNLAFVNGVRLRGMSRVDRAGRDFTLDRADAARIQMALTVYPNPEKTARAPRKSSAPPKPPPSPPAVAGRPEWKVSLGRPWLYIVIHHSGTASGSAASFHRSHRRDRGWDGLGYHFVIGNGRGAGDGQIETGYRWSKQLTGAHAGRPRPDVNLMNERGIGICLVGDFNQTKPTAKQRKSLHALVDWLRSYCRIPSNHVLVHRDIRGTECPGRHFPAAEFLTPHRDVPKSYR